MIYIYCFGTSQNNFFKFLRCENLRTAFGQQNGTLPEINRLSCTGFELYISNTFGTLIIPSFIISLFVIFALLLSHRHRRENMFTHFSVSQNKVQCSCPCPLAGRQCPPLETKHQNLTVYTLTKFYFESENAQVTFYRINSSVLKI